MVDENRMEFLSAIKSVELIIEERNLLRSENDLLRRESEALRARIKALLRTQEKLIAEYAQMEELES